MFNTKIVRVLFMGTPKMSADLLELLIKNGVNIIAVIAQEDKEVGRKKILEPVPTKIVAKQHNIPVYQPSKIKDNYEFVRDLKPDLILTFAYGQIVPQGLLDIPTHGALNLHASLLPKYRGAAPIQYAIINDEKVTGVTLMKMVAKMDAGTMYAKEEVAILPTDNYTSLCRKIVNAALKVFIENFVSYYLGSNQGVEQDESQATFANKITEEDEHININASAREQINHIRALSETPGAYLLLNEEKVKIYQAKIFANEKRYEIGQIAYVDKRLVYQASDALIELIEIKPQGKNKMLGRDYINGHPNIVGQLLK